MPNKELRKMSREELIEIIYALQQNEKKLEQEKKDIQKKLDDHIIRINEAGNIADAALSVNKVFEAAQAAADDYLASIKALQIRTQNASIVAESVNAKKLQENAEQSESSENVLEANEKAVATVKEAEAKAEEIVKAAERKAELIDEEMKKRAKARIVAAEKNIRQQMSDFYDVIYAVIEQHPEIGDKLRAQGFPNI